MREARLTGSLLARKGGAAPLAGAYGGTSLEPLIGLFGRGMIRPAGRVDSVELPPPATPPRLRLHATSATPPPPAVTTASAGVRMSLRLDPERHTRLRIVAARKGTRPQDLLREALDSVLAAAPDDCPCVRGELPCCSKGDG